MLRAATVLILLLGLAACGQLPRPFAPEQKSQNALLELKDRAGITVLPMTGDIPQPPGSMARAMVEALHGLNVPAALGQGNRESRVLETHSLVLPQPDGRDEVLLYWDLRAHDGARVGIHNLRRVLPRGAWQAGDPRVIAALTAEAAPAIAALVQNPPVEVARIPGFPGARLVILPLESAPGDAAVSLPRALAAEFLAADLPVADKIGENDLLVLGDVEVGPPKDGLQEVAIKWQVIRARGDEELGEITQRNHVPAGSLDGPWGAAAREIARGAAAGMIDLLGSAGKL